MLVLKIIQIIIGIFTLLIGSNLFGGIMETIHREVKPDKMVIFWCVYSLVVGAFLIIAV